MMKKSEEKKIRTAETVLFIAGETILIAFLVWYIIHHKEANQNLVSNLSYFWECLKDCF